MNGWKTGWSSGIKYFFVNGDIASVDDKPAAIDRTTQMWFANNLLHRENGPAVITTVAYKFYTNGKLDRIVLNPDYDAQAQYDRGVIAVKELGREIPMTYNEFVEWLISEVYENTKRFEK